MEKLAESSDLNDSAKEKLKKMSANSGARNSMLEVQKTLSREVVLPNLEIELLTMIARGQNLFHKDENDDKFNADFHKMSSYYAVLLQILNRN